MPGWKRLSVDLSPFLVGVLSVIEPSIIWLAQLPASPHVLELAKPRPLLFPQQGSQGLGEVRRYGLALVQVPRDLPLDVGNLDAVLGFAHGRPPSPFPKKVMPPRMPTNSPKGANKHGLGILRQSAAL